MKGSQKQIDWANKIKKEMLSRIDLWESRFDDDIAKAKKAGQPLPPKNIENQIREGFEKARQAIILKDDATWYIKRAKTLISKNRVLELAETGDILI